MIQAGESLPFVTEAPQDFVAVQARPYQLDCDLLAELAVRAHRQKDCAHTTLSNSPHELVDPEAMATHGVVCFHAFGQCRLSQRKGLEKAGAGFVTRSQRQFHFPSQRTVSDAGT